MSEGFDERWLRPGGVVPVDMPTTTALLNEIHRLRASDRRGMPRLVHLGAGIFKTVVPEASVTAPPSSDGAIVEELRGALKEMILRNADPMAIARAERALKNAAPQAPDTARSEPTAVGQPAVAAPRPEVARVDVPLALPADEKKRVGEAIAAEMQKNWQCDDDVIDSFGRVAAVAYVLGMRPRVTPSASRAIREDAYRRAFILVLAEVFRSGWFNTDAAMKGKVLAYLQSAPLSSEEYTVEKVLHDAMGLPTDAERAFSSVARSEDQKEKS